MTRAASRTEVVGLTVTTGFEQISPIMEAPPRCDVFRSSKNQAAATA
jgi:hypothetical protein